MKVRATQLGYYELKRRKPGQEFTLSNPAFFSSKWMEKVDVDSVDAVPVAEPIVETPVTKTRKSRKTEDSI